MSSTHSGPYRVGLTASLAAGKSTALSHAVKRGFPTLNTDALTHEILNGPNPAYEQVLKRFGSHLAEPPGAPIDRTKLARIVF
jgi:dephospho-CoA kinase